MDGLIAILLIIAGILNLILFFKVWGMTNDVRSILNVILRSQNSPDNGITKKSKSSNDGWS